MKKVIFLALLCLIAIPKVVAQEMPSVAGVTFGWTYEQCKEILDRKYIPISDFLVGPNELQYRDISLGGHHFDNASFVFQSNEKSYLSQVFLIREFDLTQKAKASKFIDELFETYSKKYICKEKYVNKDGYTVYLLGRHPLDWSQPLITISVGKFKQLGFGNKTKLQAFVEYGPIEFVKPEDEI